MNRLNILALGALLMIVSCSTLAATADGLIRVKSPYDTAKTATRFIENAKAKGLKIFDRIDHAQGAKSVDMSLRPTEVIIFGNPKGGTPLMQCAQTIGIDLPLKALVWKDSDGQVWLGYNDPSYIAQRHGVADCKAVTPVTSALAKLAEQTVAP